MNVPVIMIAATSTLNVVLSDLLESVILVLSSSKYFRFFMSGKTIELDKFSSSSEKHLL
tara:strand:- start:47 stop:223 length:177 start_codon:yes stop_codon:yes gene_type:complete